MTAGTGFVSLHIPAGGFRAKLPVKIKAFRNELKITVADEGVGC
jgi:hypothetical protein